VGIVVIRVFLDLVERMVQLVPVVSQAIQASRVILAFQEDQDSLDTLELVDSLEQTAPQGQADSQDIQV